MFTNIIHLFVLTYNTEANKQVVVSSEENSYCPISIELSPKHSTIDSALQELFEQYIQMGFGWTRTILVDIKKEENQVHSTFACTIPADTQLKQGYYLGTNLAIIHPIGRKAIRYV